MLDGYTCANHGWLSHVTTHKAGHATAAILLEFEFGDVAIDSPHESLLAWAGGASLRDGEAGPSPRCRPNGR